MSEAAGIREAVEDLRGEFHAFRQEMREAIHGCPESAESPGLVGRLAKVEQSVGAAKSWAGWALGLVTAVGGGVVIEWLNRRGSQ